MGQLSHNPAGSSNGFVHRRQATRDEMKTARPGAPTVTFKFRDGSERTFDLASAVERRQSLHVKFLRIVGEKGGRPSRPKLDKDGAVERRPAEIYLEAWELFQDRL